jgi:hypothetical protein
MIVKIEINLDTLEITSTDELVTVIDNILQDRVLSLEISKPDPEPEHVWQQ